MRIVDGLYLSTSPYLMQRLLQPIRRLACAWSSAIRAGGRDSSRPSSKHPHGSSAKSIPI